MENTTICNSTNSMDLAPCDFEYPVPAAAAFMFVGMVIVIENVVGILTIYNTPVLHTTANIFVCSMAVTDLAAGFSCMLANILILVSNFESVPDKVAAYGLMVMMIIFGMVILSCAHMAVIALERYIYIAHPFIYMKYMSPGRIRKVVTIFWACSILYLSVLFIHYFSDHETSPCSRQMPDAWGLILSMVIYALSLVVSITSYALIGKVVLEQKRLHLTQNVRLDAVAGKRRECHTVVQKEKMLKETKKTISFFGWVFCIFIMFTLPPAVLFLVDLCCYKLPNKTFRVVTAPAILNSGVNFLLLMKFNKQFKTSFLSAFKRVPSVKMSKS